MNIISVNPDTVKMGRTSFAAYRSALLCGPTADVYLAGVRRETGLRLVPGSITACIEHGMTTRDQILNAVARSTHCRRSTVASVLDELTGDDCSSNLWGLLRGEYFSWSEVQLDRDQPRVLLAA